MIERFLFGGAVLLAGVYTCMPREDMPHEPDKGGLASNNASVHSMESSASGWGGSDATLKRNDDGHFYADAYVNGMEVHFLIDSGASVVALTGADAETMGLSWNEEDIQPIGTGASGTVLGVPVMLDQVELAGYEARNVRAVIIPHGLEISLLGQSYLGSIDNVSITGDELILGG